MYGHDDSFVFPLKPKAYLSRSEGLLNLLADLDARIAVEESKAAEAKNFEFIRQKMSLLALNQDAIKRRIANLQEATDSGFAAIDSVVSELESSQRAQFASTMTELNKGLAGAARHAKCHRL